MKHTKLTIFVITSMLIALAIEIVSIAIVWSALKPQQTTQHMQSSIALEGDLSEPMDIQPAGGYKLLNDTYNPQGFNK